jgi:ribosomal subunit interface protein
MINITIKATNAKLTDELRSYVLEKFGALGRFFENADPDTVSADVEVGRPSEHHRKGQVCRCEINLRVGGTLLRAEDEGETMYEAIDKVRDAIEREARKLKSKRRALFLRHARTFARRLKSFRFRR